MKQMENKILLIATLLCLAVQGTWADKWDGVTYSIPEYNTSTGIITINTAAEFAYIHDRWGSSIFILLNSRYHQAKYKLNADLDMTIKPWTPLGSEAFTGTFDGNGHTIRITISDVTDNYQGLFGRIDSYGKVRNLHVAGNIHCKASRLVGGICGENDGTIENCWVSADVSSDWQNSSVSVTGKVGGIAGENNGTIQFCCMTGNVANNDADVGGLVGDNSGATLQHCTFYGSVSSTHKQDSKYVGNDGTEEDLYDTYYDVHYSYASGSGNTMYSYAYKYPYAINISTEGYGSVRVSAGGENDIRGWHSGETITLTKTKGTVSRIDIKDANGNWVYSHGDINGTLEFTMPKSDVSVVVVFGQTFKGSGTETNPYLISNAEDWNELAFYVTGGNNYKGKFVKLTADISVSEMVGTSETNSFQGTFLGDGVHTLTFTKGTPSSYFNEECCAPFRHVKDATIRDLRVAGDIYMAKEFAGGLVSKCYGTTSITNCNVGTVIHSSTTYPLPDGMIVTTRDGDYDGSHGGVVALPAGALNITGCAYSGRLLSIKGTARCGGFVGWHNDQTITVNNSLYAPNADIKGMSGEVCISVGATFVRGGSPTINNCFYTETMGAVQGQQAFSAVPNGDLSRVFMTIDGKKYYILCIVSNVMDFYVYTGHVIDIVPAIAAADGTVFTEGTDYTYTISPATVQEKGYYTMTITGKGSCLGTKTMTFEVEEMPTASTLTTGEYHINENKTRTDRIYIKGDVVLHLAKGTTCNLKKGIELREGHSLTIDGEGTLTIDDCDSGKSGIGAHSVGVLTINGGTINATGGDYAAALGGDKNNAKGGTITINDGVVNAKGGKMAAGIGGGADDQVGHYGVCGDITINGGQVTAQGGYRAEKYWRYGNLAGIGPGAEKPNPEGDYYDSGTLKLGWTKTTDFVDCSGFANPQGSTLTSIAFADGKKFLLEGTETEATIENCRSRKMVAPFGSKQAPLTISTTAEWNDFVAAVADGNSFKGKFVKLTADISVSTKCGIVEGNVQKNAFSGTFDGDGHTITATITDNSNQGTALFCYINGATIKNLKVAGSITGGMHAAAIVGFSSGTGNNILNCVATANVSGGSHIGGILGHGLKSDISISGCTYSGLMTGGGVNKGAIFGWGDKGGIKSVTDCLYIMQNGQNPNNLDLVSKYANDVKVTNSYKTTADSNGKQPQNARRSTVTETDETDDEPDDSIYDAIWANEYDTMPDYFGEFVIDYGFLKVYEGGLEYDGKYYVVNILLADDADNSALILLTNEYIVDATLTGRTFHKNGTWQTICLPFDLDVLEGTPLEGAKVMTLDNSEGCNTGLNAETGTLTLNFVDANKIEAGKPYIVKWDSGEDIVNPVFRGVTISYDDPVELRTMSEDERVHFVGIYCPVQLEANNFANLYLGSEGQLHCPEAAGYYLNSFRAGFLVDFYDETAPSEIVTNLGDVTGIENRQWTIDNGQSGAWYLLDGRKISNGQKPKAKGIYIVNGKKVVVK